MPVEIRKKAIEKNRAVYSYFYNKCRTRALSRYQWTNLPTSVDQDMLELYLYRYGQACFVYDDQLGFLALPCTGQGGLNVNQQFTEYMVQYTVLPDKLFYLNNNFVLIKNNREKRPTKPLAIYHAEHLTDVRRNMDINLNTNKKPYILLTDSKNKFTLQNFMNDVAENDDSVFVSKSLDIENGIKILDLNAKLQQKELREELESAWSDFLTDIGINNLNVRKKERTITDEINSNNEETEYIIEDGLTSRKKACEEFNRMFGLNIDVIVKETAYRRNTQLELELKEAELNDAKKGEED